MTTRFLRNMTLALIVGAAAGCTPVVYEPGEPPPPPPEAAEPAPPPPIEGDAAFFYDSLAPYGSWVTVTSYGTVWVPRVSPWWRPYTEGHWVYTQDGWTWVGTEPWAWAACHYGRWFWEAEYGWAWVPGTVWAPAWVAWRSGGGYIGWAPLPPSVRWEAGIGFSNGGVGFRAVIAPEHWCFVEEREVTAPAIRDYVAPRARNVTFVNITNNITNYTVVNNRIVNNSVDVDHIERVSGQPVPRYHIVDRESPAGLHGQSLQANEIPMVRRVEAIRAAPAGSGAPAGGTGQPSRTSAATVTSTTAASRVETPEEVQRRYQLEREELRTKHENDRVRLQQIQQAEASRKPSNVTADQLKARHLAEEQALEAQHLRETQMLAKRRQRELDAAMKAKVGVKPKPTPRPKNTRKSDKKPQ